MASPPDAWAISAERHAVDPGPVNLGKPEELSVLELAHKIRHAVGPDSGTEFVPRPEDDPTERCPDVTPAARLLDWRPRVGLDEGLAASVGRFRDRLLTEVSRSTADWVSRASVVMESTTSRLHLATH